MKTTPTSQTRPKARHTPTFEVKRRAHILKLVLVIMKSKHARWYLVRASVTVTGTCPWQTPGEGCFVSCGVSPFGWIGGAGTASVAEKSWDRKHFWCFWIFWEVRHLWLTDWCARIGDLWRDCAILPGVLRSKTRLALSLRLRNVCENLGINYRSYLSDNSNE